MGCEYVSHCLGKKYEAVELCLTDNFKECLYYKAMERLKQGSITDK